MIIRKILLFIFIISSVYTYGQTPGFNYQALILNNTEIQVPGTDISKNKVPLGLEDVILQFTITNENDIEYIEEHKITTDENGMVSVIVGEGKPLTNTFTDINWDGKLKYLNVEIDILSNNEGLVFLDSQKILYIPHPTQNANIVIVSDTTNLKPPYNKGQLVWVEEFGDNKLPSLIIWDGNKWVPINNDFDPTNELDITVVNNNVARNTQFPNPKIGNQVYNKACSCIEVFDGTSWVAPQSATQTNATNGLTSTNAIVKLGGVLTEPTEITTSATNTLAIKNLKTSTTSTDELVVVEKNTGILKKRALSSFTEQEEAIVFAKDGQKRFGTPLPITNPKKIDVFRNGVRIEFSVVNQNTIELEPEAVCYRDDKIRIVQLR